MKPEVALLLVFVLMILVQTMDYNDSALSEQMRNEHADVTVAKR